MFCLPVFEELITMQAMDRKARDLSEHDTACARRLKAIYTDKKRALHLTQAKLAERFGMSQSGVWQYINGRIPLNLPATIRFAEALECDVQDIDPRAPDTRWLSDYELRIIEACRRMGDTERQIVLRLAEISAAYSNRE